MPLKAHEINKRIKRAKRGCAESAWALYEHFEVEFPREAFDDPERKSYLELAADNGHVHAQSIVSEFRFREGILGVSVTNVPLSAEQSESKVKEAVAWCLKVVNNEREFGEDEKGFKLSASHRLGIIYSQGLGGVEQNLETAF